MIIKDTEALFNEIRQSNEVPDEKLNIIHQNLTEIENTYLAIRNFSLNDIKNETKHINKVNLLVALMMRANELLFGYLPRQIQIISILFFIFKEKQQGLLLEIKTGEGKTLIISFLAVIKAKIELCDVDIITSSNLLAERDAKEKKIFYELFGLSVDYCRDEESSKKDCLQCYKANICYGDCLNFEADILKTYYLGKCGRGYKRHYDCIIIDEIDNITIDNIKNRTEILDNFPGYKFLEFFYLYIYQKLLSIDEEYKKEQNYEFLVKFKKDKIIRDLAKTIDEFFYNNDKKSDKEKIYYPNYLKEFVISRKLDWCQEAYEAKYIYKENKHYIIEKKNNVKRIIIVDFYNTGTLQKNSVWAGLHQFLEIKEGLRLTEENVNSCYISNLSFFKKYINDKNNNLYGVTGTMDCPKTSKVLTEIYKMKQLIIPTFKISQFINFGSVIIDQKEKYINKIIGQILEISKNRACLVIFEYIQQANDMYRLLKNVYKITNNIIVYSKDDQSNFLSKELNIGDIILSTNLSGRGTDIKISSLLEQNGGLHVILTFFPESKRIEMQALGRAGRKGEKGSGEIIIYSFEKSINILEKKREERENENYNELINNFVERNNLYQDLFENFCAEIKNIKSSSSVEDKLIEDIKERWGLFLVANKINSTNAMEKKDIILRRFKELKDKIQNSVNFCLYNNPFILCKKRNIDSLLQANNLSNLSLGSMYYSIPLQIIQYKLNVSQTINSFQKLKYQIELLINQLNKYEEIIININKREYKEKTNDLFNQNIQKKKVFEIINNNIKNNISYLSKIINHEDKYILIYNNKMTKKLIDEIDKNYPDDIINYFYDYGLDFLYDLWYQEKKNISMVDQTPEAIKKNKESCYII